MHSNDDGSFIQAQTAEHKRHSVSAFLAAMQAASARSASHQLIPKVQSQMLGMTGFEACETKQHKKEKDTGASFVQLALALLQRILFAHEA